MAADRSTPKGNALAGLAGLTSMLGDDMAKPDRFMARGLVEYIRGEVEAIQEVKRARRPKDEQPDDDAQDDLPPVLE